MFFVVSGKGIIRFDGTEYPITEGDVIYTPAGENTAHQMINTSDSPLKYLAINSVSNPDICYYPDSGKYGSYNKKDDGSWQSFIAHKSSSTDYFEGEEK